MKKVLRSILALLDPLWEVVGEGCVALCYSPGSVSSRE
jgi:hypothetical protein